MKTKNSKSEEVIAVPNADTVRCAIYARYSSDLQRPSSIEDQIRKCRQESKRHAGWIVEEDWVLADQELTGRTLAGRDALARLKEAAKRKSRPFDYVVIDDTSRLGRNVPDVLKLAEVFEHHGVSLQFVSPPLNSRDPNFRPLLIFKAMMDEQYSTGLADKVWRGLEGRVLKGYSAGAPCYGYKNVEEIDPNGKGDGVIGVRLEIIPEQAEVVRRIFTMYADGFSLERVARALRADGLTAPKPPRTNSARGWSADGVAEILRNKKYIGINEWGRTKTGYDPETGRTVTRRRPEAEWVRFENPKWRIVPAELWQKVQEELARKKSFGIAKHGGLNRTPRSQQYLFSGLIFCGVCNLSISIVDGSGDEMRYGCGAHRFKGACSNAFTIRQDRFEEQLLPWLTRDLLNGSRLDRAATAFYTKVLTRVSELQAEARKNAVNEPELRKERAEKKKEASNLTDCIAANGLQSFPTVKDRLTTAELRIAEIDELLAQAKETAIPPSFSASFMRDQLLSKLRDLQGVLTSAPSAGKQILRKHIRKITLTPGQVDSKRALYVTIEFELGSGNSGVMLTDEVGVFLQQYGFSTISVAGPVLDTSRARRKPVPLPKKGTESHDTAINPPALVRLSAEGSAPQELSA